MKTNHINHPKGGMVYCHRMNSISKLDSTFFVKECQHCPYYAGTDQGRGVECTFDDACHEGEVVFYTPADSERHSQMQYARLGMKGEKEVLDSLQTQQIESSKEAEAS